MEDSKHIRKLTHPAFRYRVDVGGEAVAAFTECTLPTIEWEVEEVKEGGLNTYVHQLPSRRKSNRITLKNGVGKSGLFDWYVEGMKETYSRKSVTITLLDVAHNEVMVWSMIDAWPIKWTGPQLKSDANTIAIQTLDLACEDIAVEAK